MDLELNGFGEDFQIVSKAVPPLRSSKGANDQAPKGTNPDQMYFDSIHLNLYFSIFIP